MTLRTTDEMGERKITLGEMRDSGPTRLLIYCGDYHCAHSVVVDADRWSDDVRLSDLEPLFTCKAFGHRGADVLRDIAVPRLVLWCPQGNHLPRRSVAV
ncbi:MAG: hypothetical protein ACJ8EL_18570 [Rhizomicrobium sp.]